MGRFVNNDKVSLFQWLSGRSSESRVETASGSAWYNVEKGTWRTGGTNDLPRRSEIGFAEVVDRGSGERSWWQFWRSGDGGDSDVIHAAPPRGPAHPIHDHRVEESRYRGRPDPLPWPGSVGTGEGPTRGGANPHTGDPYIPWPGTGDERRYGGWGDPRGQ